MDLESFAADKFDSKSWINQAWKTSKGKEDKEVFVGNAVKKLQLYMQQLNMQLEDSSMQVVSSIPKVLQDASMLQRDAVLLKDKLLALEEQVASVEEATGHSIKSLQRIDQLKGKLENAAFSLREADKWAALATALEERLESGPAQGAALQDLTNMLNTMTSSLEVMSESPDYEDKRMQLEGLCNRLEAALSPTLVDAFTNHNTESARAMVGAFSAMRREAALQRYWRRCAAAKIASSSQDASTLRDIHAVVMQYCYSELEWCRSVWGSETWIVEELCGLCGEALSAGAGSAGSARDSLDALSDLAAAVKTFAEGFASTVLDYGPGRKGDISAEALHQLGWRVLEPLRQLMPRYGELQAKLLAQHLTADAVTPGPKDDPIERARIIVTEAERSQAWLESALSYGKKLAGPACFPYLVPAVESFLALHCSRLRANRRHLENLLTPKQSDQSKSDNVQGSQHNALGDRLWAVLAPILALMKAAGELMEGIDKFARILGDAILETDNTIKSPLQDYEALLLDESGKQTLASLRESVTEATSVLSPSEKDLSRVCRDLRSTALQVVFQPIATQLERIPTLAAWCENDPDADSLPDYSFTPQEYITQIGQYLMTLPQHLEALLGEAEAGGAALALALQLSAGAAAAPPHLAQHFLNEVCTSTCELYCDRILAIKNLDALGAKRCATDVAYVCSIVEELGACDSSDLRRLETRLRAT